MFALLLVVVAGCPPAAGPATGGVDTTVGDSDVGTDVGPGTGEVSGADDAGDTTGEPADATSSVEIPAAVETAIAELGEIAGVEANRDSWALYRYPETVPADTEVVDADGNVIASAPAEARIWWADLEPGAMFEHPGQLFFLHPETDEVLSDHATFWYPTEVGAVAWEIFADDGPGVDADHPDNLKPAQEHPGAEGLFDGDVGGDGKEKQKAGLDTGAMGLEDGGEACVPSRYMIIVTGQYDKKSEEKSFGRNQLLMRHLAAHWGIPPGNVVTVKNKRGSSVEVDDLEYEIQNLDLKCCDEVILHFTGHGRTDKGFLHLGYAAWQLGLYDTRTSLFLGKTHYLYGDGLADLIGESGACKWEIILDCCFAGNTADELRDALGKKDATGGAQVGISTAVDGYGKSTSGHFAEVEKGAGGGRTSIWGTVFTQVGLGGLIPGWDDRENNKDEPDEPPAPTSPPPAWGEVTGQIQGVSSGTTYTGYNYNEEEAYENTSTRSAYSGTGPCCECQENKDCPQPADQCECGYCEQGECVDRVAILKPCDDGLWCTHEDLCYHDGSCAGSAVSCTSAQAGVSPEPDAVCVDSVTCNEGKSAAAGAVVCDAVPCSGDCPCDDGVKCTGPDACEGFWCKAGPDKDCDDDEACTADSCDPETGDCKHVILSDCCESDDDCPVEGPCMTGKCLLGACDEVPQEGPCDDGNLCTLGDQCEAGACKSGPLKTCDDDNPCTADACIDGDCDFQPQTGVACNDGDVCTTDDVCELGVCKGTDKTPCCTDAADCDDDNDCTLDGCVDGDCANVAIEDKACDDGDVCTTDDKCVAAVCSGVTLSNCCEEDGDCADEDPCTATSCVGNLCMSGPVEGCCHEDEECADEDECTDDKCLENSCTHQFLEGAECDDGDACTTDDVCSGTACWGTPVSGCCLQDEDCATDPMPCTPPFTCEAGQCAPQPFEFAIPEGGFLLPQQGGNPTQGVDWLDPEALGLFILPDGQIDWQMQMRDVVPAEIPITYGGGSVFISMSVLFFVPGLPGAPMFPDPPLMGANFMLSVGCSQEVSIGLLSGAECWQGHLWAWSDGDQSWQLVDDQIPFQVAGEMVALSAQVPEIQPCSGFKVLTQHIRDGNQGPELVWKAFTSQGTNPNGAPLVLGGEGIGVGVGGL